MSEIKPLKLIPDKIQFWRILSLFQLRNECRKNLFWNTLSQNLIWNQIKMQSMIFPQLELLKNSPK